MTGFKLTRKHDYLEQCHWALSKILQSSSRAMVAISFFPLWLKQRQGALLTFLQRHHGSAMELFRLFYSIFAEVRSSAKTFQQNNHIKATTTDHSIESSKQCQGALQFFTTRSPLSIKGDEWVVGIQSHCRTFFSPSIWRLMMIIHRRVSVLKWPVGKCLSGKRVRLSKSDLCHLFGAVGSLKLDHYFFFFCTSIKWTRVLFDAIGA